MMLVIIKSYNINYEKISLFILYKKFMVMFLELLVKLLYEFCGILGLFIM